MSQATQNKKTGELLTRILTLLEGREPGPPHMKIYNNREVKALLGIKDQYLRKLREHGYLGYSREGDKYWYTQEDVDRFLKRFHYHDFAPISTRPSF